MCVLTLSYARARSHPGLCSPLRHSIESNVSDSEGSAQTARLHLCSLIWAFAARTCPEGTFSLGVAHVFML